MFQVKREPGDQLTKLREVERLLGLVLEGEFNSTTLESLLDAFFETAFVNTKMVSGFLIERVIGVGVSKEGGKTDYDGAES